MNTTETTTVRQDLTLIKQRLLRLELQDEMRQKEESTITATLSSLGISSPEDFQQQTTDLQAELNALTIKVRGLTLQIEELEKQLADSL